MKNIDEGEWLKRKHALLERLSKEKSTRKTDRENLAKERQRLIPEIDRLEEENHIMAKSVKDFELQLVKRREICQSLYEKSDGVKENLVQALAGKNNLLHEIELCESEKAVLSETYSEISEKLMKNVSSLENTVNDIGFMKGEVQVLIKKMEVLEGEVPVKSKDMLNVDEKVMGAIKALKGLYNRMQAAERGVKVSYYKNKNNKGVAI